MQERFEAEKGVPATGKQRHERNSGMKKLASVLLVILLLIQLMPFAAAEEAEHAHGAPEIPAEDTAPLEEPAAPAAEGTQGEGELPVPGEEPVTAADPDEKADDGSSPVNEQEDPDVTLPGEDDAPEVLPADETEIPDVPEPRDAAAAAPTKVWLAASDASGIPMQIDLFVTQKSGTSSNPTYTGQLYLPGSAVLSQCFLSWNGDMAVTYENRTYASGSCPIPAATGTQATYTFKSGSETVGTYRITAYQGSPGVTAVFIDIDESGDNPTIAEMDGDADHEVTCTGRINIAGTWYDMPKIKGRGNATWKEAKDKKPYNVTLGSKITFPGVSSEPTKKWSFLAENLDRSLLGNRAGYWLAYEMGIGQDTASADVWMNGEYQGCYTVTPKTDSYVTKNGFMIEQDNYKEKKVSEGGDPQFSLDGLVTTVSGWDSAYNLITVKKMGDNLLKNDQGVVDDENPVILEAAAARIRDWLQEAWDAIRSDDGYNSKGRYYTEYIDIESFAKMYLMQEYVKSFDVCAGSILFHRDGQTDADKLYAGPLWDLDNAMGSTYNNTSLGSQSDRRSGQGHFIQNITEYKTSIYRTLRKHGDFLEEVERQYNKNRAYFEALESDYEQMAAEIEASAAMNFAKVTDLGNSNGKNNHYYSSGKTFSSTDGNSYSETYVKTTSWSNYTANMKTYIRVRSQWFENYYYDPDYVDPATCDHRYEIVTVPATCTADGSATYTCPICHDVKVEALPQIAHDYRNGVCSVCGETLWTATIVCGTGASVTVCHTQDPAGEHEDGARTAHPRSGDTGLIDCSGEGQINFIVRLEPGYVLDSVTAAPKTSYKNLKLPADTGIENGYRLTKVSGDLTITVEAHCAHDHLGTVTPPTCTEEGYTTYVCRYCGDTYVSDRTDPLGHDLTDHAAQAPTCTDPGWQAYQTCARCGWSTYAELAPLGHAPAEAVSEDRIDPTCTEAGSYDDVVYCSVCGAELSRTAKSLDPTGHTWGTPSYEWSADNRTVTATRVCARDGGHRQTETANAASAVTKPATCEGKGETTYTAAFANAAFETQAKTVADIPERGHTPGQTVIENVIAPSGETDGRHDEAVYCQVCGKELSRRTVTDRAIRITKQPEDRQVRLGETAVFSVTAEGEGLAYRWQYSTGGAGWTDCVSDGSDTDTFSFRMTAALSDRLYRCIVQNEKQTVISDEARLTLRIDAPVITEQPSGQNVKEGERATFTVTAAGDDLTYRWQVNKTGTWNDCVSAGHDTETFSFPAKSGYNGWQYRCIVSNAAGSVTSSAAKLTVRSRPVITKQPSDQDLTAGQTAEFTVTATGDGLAYQWQVNKTGTWNDCVSPGNDTATFTFTAKTSYSGWQYRCVITGDAGSTTSQAARLTVAAGGPRITQQPADQSAAPGETAVFTVKATGSNVTYQWQYSANAGAGWTNCARAGYDTDTFSFAMTASLAGRLYRCVLRDDTGTTVSETARLTLGGPAITRQPADQSVTVGESAVFTVKATGTGLSYRWQYSSNNGVSWVSCVSPGNDTDTFRFHMTAGLADRLYRCIVTDATGSVKSGTARLTLKSGPSVTGHPKDQSVRAGEKAGFTAKTSEAGASYQWQVSRDGGVTWRNCTSAGNTSATFAFTAKTSYSGWQYRCVITGQNGSAVTDAALLTVN